MCRHQSEVTAVLNDLGKDSKTEPEAEGLGQAFEEGIPDLARLRLAITYNQKRVSWALPTPSSPRPALTPLPRHLCVVPAPTLSKSFPCPQDPS